MMYEGKSSLSEVLKVLSEYIDNSSYSNTFESSYLLENSTELALELLIVKPIILYVKRGVLSSNNAYLNIDYIADEIIEIEDIYTLLILRNLQLSDQKKYEISWIAYEAPVAIKKSVFLSKLSSIDVFMERNKNTGNNSVGRLDYEKIENLFVQIGGKKLIENLTISKKCKYFISCVFNIKLNSKKNNYENKVSMDKTLENYNITNDDIKKVYRCKCLVCDKMYSVILHGNVKKSDIYIMPKDIMDLVQYEKKYYSRMLCKKCRTTDNDDLPLCLLTKYPDSENEINKAFLRLYHSLMIDPSSMLEVSRRIVAKHKKEDTDEPK